MSKDKKWINLTLKNNIPNSLDYAHWILTKVSRTFALNIVILPIKVKINILIAYLFCRMADTLEDDPLLSQKEKIHLLQEFSSLISNNITKKISEFQSKLPIEWKTSHNYDQFLTYHGYLIFDLFKKESLKNQTSLQKWINKMIQGMIHFLKVSETNSENQIIWITQNTRELDIYCYFVAGIIGKMLTEIFYNNCFQISKNLKKKLDIYANSFGIGLQLTNILKDVYKDYDRGVSFIPLSLVLEQISTPNYFLTMPSPLIRPIIKNLVSKTQTHLEDAFLYTLLIPRTELKIRLFCLWPLFMAIATLHKILKENGDLKIKSPIKITRKELKKIIFRTVLYAPSNTLLKKYFDSYNKKINHHLYS